ncbi:TATA-binding related factor [Piromyces finnis]|uniref:Mediator of RNA polymerase II transcription subunit 20 n=1 Tax=Piromyces finnis TaxID=1754191 RepID=A0A1Y1UVI5_9FUNG|nr:TATA-binding related factor [Piromyces finnis]|eukprot:ORX41487.1 TATA-binding related factor [Piromyces finnis]
MGVTCIFYIKEPSIVSNIMSTMERRIKNLFGGKKLDPWNVVCKLYKSVTFPRIPLELIKNSGRGESMYLLSFSSKPSHVYTIIDEKIVMETDNALIELVTKIKNIWTIRQTAKIDGYNYEIGDYNVRYGNLNVGSHSKGLVVEVEHTKSTSVTKSSDLLIEFIDYLIPKELYKNYKLELKLKERANYNFIFTSRHTAYQYINLLRSEKIL